MYLSLRWIKCDILSSFIPSLDLYLFPGDNAFMGQICSFAIALKKPLETYCCNYLPVISITMVMNVTFQWQTLGGR